MRDYTILLFVLISIFFASCNGQPGKVSGENLLPYLGRHDYQEKVVNNQTVVDTLYHQVADFSFLNQDSLIVTPATFENKVYVTDFFFTT